MSYVVVVSTSSVLYTPPTGAENAFAGQTIASATWNAIFTDLCNNGLKVVGASPALTLKGNASGAAAVVTDLTPAQVQGFIGQPAIAVKVSGVSFGTTAIETQFPVTLPAGYTRYRVDQCTISQASGTLAGATVGLFTATGAGGTAIVTSSTATTVTSSLENTVNNSESLTINNLSIIDYTASPLFFRIGSVTAAQTATVTLYVKPIS